VRISAPKESAADYFSRYKQYDFLIQGVVDGKMLFTDFSAGFPGSLHDARALRNIVIFQGAENQEIVTDPVIQIGCNRIGPYLVGDSAYPLSSWLSKPFPEATRNPRAARQWNRIFFQSSGSLCCFAQLLHQSWGRLAR